MRFFIYPFSVTGCQPLWKYNGWQRQSSAAIIQLTISCSHFQVGILISHMSFFECNSEMATTTSTIIIFLFGNILTELSRTNEKPQLPESHLKGCSQVPLRYHQLYQLGSNQENTNHSMIWKHWIQKWLEKSWNKYIGVEHHHVGIQQRQLETTNVLVPIIKVEIRPETRITARSWNHAVLFTEDEGIVGHHFLLVFPKRRESKTI